MSCLRESLFTSEPCAGRSISNLYFEKIVYDDIRERYLDLRQLEEKMKCVFLSAATSFYVNKIDYSGCLATVSAYEWNEIQYRCQGYDETDRMGFGSHHLLVFEKGDNGIIHILQDSFDERTSVGFHSSDLECQEHVFLIADGVADRMILSGGNTSYSGYNASAAVAYANTWCGVSAANTNSGTIHPENYNPDYYYALNDCANFVSQCLYAGGVSLIPGNYYSGWYYTPVTAPGGTGAVYGGDNSGSFSWMNVFHFMNLWTAQGIFLRNGNVMNLFPGNPVFWVNSITEDAGGHLMICTGYNAANTPVLNAHNGDMKQVPVTAIDHPAPLYTFIFKFIHNWVVEGNHFRCNVCGSVQNTIPSPY